MSRGEDICSFQSFVEVGEAGAAVAVTICTTHGVKLQGLTVATTQGPDGPDVPLCAAGRVEYAVQQSIERLTAKLDELERRLGEHLQKDHVGDQDHPADVAGGRRDP